MGSGDGMGTDRDGMIFVWHGLWLCHFYFLRNCYSFCMDWLKYNLTNRMAEFELQRCFEFAYAIIDIVHQS